MIITFIYFKSFYSFGNKIKDRIQYLFILSFNSSLYRDVSIISIKFKQICFVYGIEINKYPILLDWRHMIIRAFLDIYIYISVWWTQKVFKWPEPSTNRVFNCVQYFHGLCIVSNIMKIRTLFERFSKRYYLYAKDHRKSWILFLLIN